MSQFTGEATYLGLGDTDGFFSSYLQQPSDTKASLFKKSTNDFFQNLERSTNNLLSGRQLIKRIIYVAINHKLLINYNLYRFDRLCYRRLC